VSASTHQCRYDSDGGPCAICGYSASEKLCKPPVQKMSASETPLTDSIGFIEIYDANGQPYHADLVPADNCRAIELRLRECVEALEELELQYSLSKRPAPRMLTRAIANARNPVL
jgi:hypothetical protein